MGSGKRVPGPPALFVLVDSSRETRDLGWSGSGRVNGHSNRYIIGPAQDRSEGRAQNLKVGKYVVLIIDMRAPQPLDY